MTKFEGTMEAQMTKKMSVFTSFVIRHLISLLVHLWHRILFECDHEHDTISNQHLAISDPKTTLALCEFSSPAARVSLGRILSKHYSPLATTSPFSTISMTFTIRGLSARMWPA